MCVRVHARVCVRMCVCVCVCVCVCAHVHGFECCKSMPCVTNHTSKFSRRAHQSPSFLVMSGHMMPLRVAAGVRAEQ
jgi:hypothetical protein